MTTRATRAGLPIVLCGFLLSPPPVAAQAVTYASDIAPIIANHCAACHRPGQVAPFSLLGYGDVRPRAREIVRSIESGHMPPWKPEPGHGVFVGERRLTDAERALVRNWADQGFQRGSETARPPTRQWPTGWQFGQPDLVVSMPEAYTLQPGRADIFRTFVVPIPLAARRYVKALEFNPGNFRVVHHANIKIDPTRFSRRWDDNEPGPGYAGGGSREATFPDGHFMGWTPGQSARVSPPDMAWRLDPDVDLVVEMHLMPTDRRETVQFSVALFFTDEPPVRSPFMLRLGRQDLDIPPGVQSYVNEDSYVLPVDVRVLAVQPHAHYLAREAHGFATLPDGSTRELVYIKDWDFHWQDVYSYQTPIALPKGTTLAMRYVYDNSAGNPHNPNHPPRRVTFGQTSASEMGSLWIQVVPLNPADLETLALDFSPKLLRDDIAGNEKWLDVEPANPRLHAELAACYGEAGRLDEAVMHLREAVRLDPTAGRHYDLGLALLAQRKFDQAKDAFNQTLALKADFPEALLNLGVVEHQQGNLDEAVAYYRRASLQGLDDTAVHYNLGRAFTAQTKYAEAIAEYKRTIELRPNDADALIGLAWVLVTADPAELRNPTVAVRLAELADALTEHRDARILDTLAAAYMAIGMTDRAIKTAERALTLATTAGDEGLAGQVRLRLDFYRQH